MGIQCAVRAGLVELNHAAAFQIVGRGIRILRRFAPFAVGKCMGLLAAGLVFRLQRQNQFADSDCTDPCGAVLAGVGRSAVDAHGERHAI